MKISAGQRRICNRPWQFREDSACGRGL